MSDNCIQREKSPNGTPSKQRKSNLPISLSKNLQTSSPLGSEVSDLDQDPECVKSHIKRKKYFKDENLKLKYELAKARQLIDETEKENDKLKNKKEELRNELQILRNSLKTEKSEELEEEAIKDVVAKAIQNGYDGQVDLEDLQLPNQYLEK